jgi:hypothetical protein
MKKTTHKSSRRILRPSLAKPPAVFVKTDFLTKKELRGLTKYVLTHEVDFTHSTVIPDGVPDPATDASYRKSRVCTSLATTER